jgi:hypothetical protein
MAAGVSLASLVLLSGVAAWRWRSADKPPLPLEECLAVLGAEARDLEAIRRGDRAEILVGSGEPTELVEIADWDSAVTWAFRAQNDQVLDEGRYQPPDRLDVHRSWLYKPGKPQRAPSRHVFVGREFWDDDPNFPGPPPKRQHCMLPPEYGMVAPVQALGQPSPGPLPPGTPTSGDAAIVLRPGVRLRAEPGKPTTIDGEPGTAYVWSPAEDPWLRAEFVLDGRNRLRSATITDTVRNEVVGEFSARPTDGRIQPPDWAG